MCFCANPQWKCWNSLNVWCLCQCKLSNSFDPVLQILQENKSVMSCAVKRILHIFQNLNWTYCQKLLWICHFLKVETTVVASRFVKIWPYLGFKLTPFWFEVHWPFCCATKSVVFPTIWITYTLLVFSKTAIFTAILVISYSVYTLIIDLTELFQKC